MSVMRSKKKSHYIRVATFSIDEVIPFVFTQKIRHALKLAGCVYNSEGWKLASKREYCVLKAGKFQKILVSMGSHRYQLFAEKGVTCVKCGLEGKYFALERGEKDSPDKFHFNLYGINKNGHEVMLTKDHIIPRSKGGENKLSNYQPMCIRCNNKKADK